MLLLFTQLVVAKNFNFADNGNKRVFVRYHLPQKVKLRTRSINDDIAV